METAVVEQFLIFFQDFIELCQSDNWPKNDTSVNELKNAFLISQHVEKCLDKLQKKGVLSEFLSVLDNSNDNTNIIRKECLLDPTKYVLKKIIISNTNISQMDVGIKTFLELFSEDKLKNCLTDLMVEAASKETLLRHVSSELSQDEIVKFKSALLLYELNRNKSDILDILKNANQTLMDLFVVSLLNAELDYVNTVTLIKEAFLHIVTSKHSAYKNFWQLIFNVDNKYFIEMCIQYTSMFANIVEALLDCGRLLKEDMSAESFYIEVNKSELAEIVKKICNNDCLKLQFFNIVEKNDFDLDFWQNMLLK